MRTLPLKPSDNRTVVIDAMPSGVSGDKYLGALLDLGGKPETLRKVARTVAENLPGTRKIDVKVRKVERGEIGAQLVTIESEDEAKKRKGADVLRHGKKCVERLQLSDWGSSFALSTIETLLQAESRVHGHSAMEVELHELGSADTLVDVLGVACLADSLSLAGATWWSSPVAVGGGTTRFSNRTYSNPPPAVAEILRQSSFPMERGPADTELSTPTGAAITVNLVSKYSESYPSFKPEKIGYGAGSKELDQVANVLRLTVGQSLGPSHRHDDIVILETNLDDVSGEVIGHAVEKLMSEGARDVTVTPVLMKKNRPGQVLSIITSSAMAERLATILFEETGTLGVREIPVHRHIANRELSRIELMIGKQAHKIRVKVSRTADGRIIRAKPEYEDLRRLADKTGLSLRVLASKAEKTAEDLLSTGVSRKSMHVTA
jgi:pyridinium-3,5-bisthiocarboxylic acid mononucleotide nickel chelatase